MRNVVFTQLSIEELRQLIREEQTEAAKEILKDLIEQKMAADKEPAEKYLNKKEAAQIGRVCTSTIDNWIRAGHFKKYKLGDSVRIRQSEFLRYLESLAV